MLAAVPCSPDRAICWKTFTISDACSAAGYAKPGLTRRLPCIILMVSKSALRAPQRRPTICSALCRSTEAAKSCGRRQRPMLRVCAFAAPTPQGCLSGCSNTGSRSARHFTPPPRVPSSSCLPTRQSCGAPTPRRSRLLSRRSDPCDRARGGPSIRRNAVQIRDSAQILDLDAERPGPPRPPATIFAVTAPGAAAHEVIVFVVDKEIEIAVAIPGDTCFGQLAAAEHNTIDIGSTGLGSILMGLGLPGSRRGSHRGGLVDQQIGDLLALGEIAGFDEDRVGRHRLA